MNVMTNSLAPWVQQHTVHSLWGHQCAGGPWLSAAHLSVLLVTEEHLWFLMLPRISTGVGRLGGSLQLPHGSGDVPIIISLPSESYVLGAGSEACSWGDSWGLQSHCKSGLNAPSHREPTMINILFMYLCSMTTVRSRMALPLGCFLVVSGRW